MGHSLLQASGHWRLESTERDSQGRPVPPLQLPHLAEALWVCHFLQTCPRAKHGPSFNPSYVMCNLKSCPRGGA